MSINFDNFTVTQALKGYIIITSLVIHAAYTAEVKADTEMSVSGFANIGLTYAPNDALGFRTSLLNKGRDDLSLLPDSQLGLQVNAQINSDLDIVGQIIIQDRFDDHISNYVEMAFLRYQFSRSWSAKVGRFNTKAYLFADYRYVGHAFNWLRPPIELYSPVGAVSNMNGVQLAYADALDIGTFKGTVAYGQARLHNDRPSGPFRLSYKNFSSVNLELQTEHWRFQTAFLSAQLSDVLFVGSEQIANVEFVVPAPLQSIARSIADRVIPDQERVDYVTAGALYNKGDFEFIAEIADYRSDWAFAASSQTAYVSLAFNMDSFTPFITVANVKRKDFPELLNQQTLSEQLPAELVIVALGLAQDATEAIQGASYDQTSFGVGLRWDINFDWAVKLQFDHFRSAPVGTGLFANKSGQAAPEASSIYNVVALSFTTTF